MYILSTKKKFKYVATFYQKIFEKTKILKHVCFIKKIEKILKHVRFI